MYFVCLFCIGFKCDLGTIPLCKSSLKVSNPVVSISTLEEDDRENLQAQVYLLTKKIRDEFEKFFVAIFSSFREKIDREKLVLTLIKEETFIQKDKVNETKSIYDVFVIIKDNCSYFNFELLETLITVLGSDQDKSCLEKYNQAFGEYCKAMPCAEGIYGSESISDRMKVTVKVDFNVEELRPDNLISIKSIIAHHVGITPGALHLCCVKEGSTLLEFLVPNVIIKEIFPLSNSQILALYSEVKLLSIESIAFKLVSS